MNDKFVKLFLSEFFPEDSLDQDLLFAVSQLGYESQIRI